MDLTTVKWLTEEKGYDTTTTVQTLQDIDWTLVAERRRQKERDMAFNFRVELTVCVKCKNIITESIDGRCMKCYDALQEQIFRP